jgi:hypothetical protein
MGQQIGDGMLDNGMLPYGKILFGDCRLHA